MVRQQGKGGNIGGLDLLGRRLNTMARFINGISHISRAKEGGPPAPVETWFDEQYVYLSALCPDAIGTEADIFVGGGRVFLRVERDGLLGRELDPTTPGKFGCPVG